MSNQTIMCKFDIGEEVYFKEELVNCVIKEIQITISEGKVNMMFHLKGEDGFTYLARSEDEIVKI